MKKHADALPTMQETTTDFTFTLEESQAYRAKQWQQQGEEREYLQPLLWLMQARNHPTITAGLTDHELEQEFLLQRSEDMEQWAKVTPEQAMHLQQAAMGLIDEALRERGLKVDWTLAAAMLGLSNRWGFSEIAPDLTAAVLPKVICSLPMEELGW